VSKGTVLISGAAGGIGIATVDRFLASGYEVAGIDLSPTVEGLRPERYRGAVADVTQPGQLATVVDRLLDGLELKHVVGLAGRVIQEEGKILTIQDSAAATEAFNSSLSLNLSGQFSLIHAALERLERAGGDRSITLCSSVNALRGYGMPAYSAAKAGLAGMTHALATPLGARGIRINVVAPGTTRTPLLESELARANDPTAMDRKAEEVPLGRIGKPEDVATVIESLADRLTYVTDEVIKVDGGHLLAQPFDRRPIRMADRVRHRVSRRLGIRPSR
jgi:NAD(P)-dependent dehydrogenase (short-subunit alcohol dehydrogenase family)